MLYDCLIVGGGAAGYSAALGLGRARRRTLLCSSGAPRNAPAHQAHNFLTRDGTPPLEILRIAREQLTPYERVNIVEHRVESIERLENQTFRARLSDGREIVTRTVILATGLKDQLDTISGLSSLWGHSVFACPFCHGWEYRDRRWAVMVDHPKDMHAIKMARSWTQDLLLCSRVPLTLETEDTAKLKAWNIPVIASPVVGLKGDRGQLQEILFADGSRLPREALWYKPPTHQGSELASQLGCSLTPEGYVKTSPPFGATEVPGVFAIGDMTGNIATLAWASASGTFAAGGVQHLLAQKDWES